MSAWNRIMMMFTSLSSPPSSESAQRAHKSLSCFILFHIKDRFILQLLYYHDDGVGVGVVGVGSRSLAWLFARAARHVYFSTSFFMVWPLRPRESNTFCFILIFRLFSNCHVVSGGKTIPTDRPPNTHLEYTTASLLLLWLLLWTDAFDRKIWIFNYNFHLIFFIFVLSSSPTTRF